MRARMEAIVNYARYELSSLLRTRRVWMVAGLYFSGTVVLSLVMAWLLRQAEQELMSFLAQGGAVDAKKLVDHEAYHRMLAFFVGVPAEDLAPTLKESLIVPVFFWCALTFLPGIILTSAFDCVANDLQGRTLLFSVQRASRAAVILGKALAHGIVLVGTLLFSCLCVVLITKQLVHTLAWSYLILGFFRVFVTLLPFGTCYVAISIFSSITKQGSFVALLQAFAVLLLLRILGWFDNIPVEHELAFLRPLGKLSPASYEPGLWLSGFSGPATGFFVYGLFGALFLALSVWRLRSLDL